MSDEAKSFKSQQLKFFFENVLVGELLVLGLMIVILSISTISVFLRVEHISTFMQSQFDYYNQNIYEILFSLLGLCSIITGGISMSIGGCAAAQSSILGPTVVPYYGPHLYDVENPHRTRITRLFKNANIMILGVFLLIQGSFFIIISLH